MPKLWRWDERSTRNCVHAKVHTVGADWWHDGTIVVRCAKGRHLRHDYTIPYGHSLSYKRVVGSASFAARTCEACPYFEHDEPDGGSDGLQS